MLILLLMKLPDHLESQRVELYQANQRVEQAQREKSWLFGELDFEKQRFIKKITQEVAKNLKTYTEIAGQKLKELVNWSMMSSVRDRMRILLQWICLWFRFKNCRTRWIPWAMHKNSMSSQPTNMPCPRGMISRDSCLHHYTRNLLEPQETYLKIYLLDTGHPQHSCKTQRNWHHLPADWRQSIQAQLLNK